MQKRKFQSQWISWYQTYLTTKNNWTKVNRNNPEMTQMLELADKDFKITIMNMF